MAESQGAVVGTIFLNLKINDTIESQLQSISKRAEQSTRAGFDKVGQTMNQSLQKPMQQASENMKQAFTKPLEEASRSAKAPLDKIQKQAQQTQDEIQKIAERAAKKVNAVDASVKMPTVAPRFPSATATQIRRGKDDADTAPKPPDVSNVFQPSADGMELLRQKMLNVNLQMESERQKLAELEGAFSKVAVGTKAWDDLSAKITAAESKLISLQQTLNSTQEKIDAPARKAAQEAEKLAAKQAAAAEKAAAVQQRAAQKAADVFERQQQRMAQAAQRTAQAAARASQRQSNAVRSVARTQASSFLSAATVQGKGITQVSALGRAAFSGLRGIGTALPLAAAFGAFKVLQKGFETASTSSKEFRNNLNQLKANLQVAFTPIYQAILPALNAMVSALSSAAKYVAAFLSALFGKTYAQSVGAAKKIQQAQKSLAPKTGGSSGSKKKEGTIASFDQIHTLQKDSSSGSSSGASGVDFNALNTAGDASATALAGKFKKAWENVASTFQDYVIKPIQDNLYKFDAPVAKFKALFADIGTQSRQWLEPINTWFRSDFKSALAQGIGDASTIFAGFADSMAMVSNTIWQTLRPAIDWIVKNGLPLMTDMFKEVSKTTVVAFDAIKTVFDTLWKGVIEPASKLISKVIVDTMEIFKELWDKYGAVTFENIRKAIDNTKNIFLSLWDNVLKPVFDKIFAVLNDLWNKHLKQLIAQIGEFSAKFINAFLDVYNGFIVPLYKGFIETLGPPITKVINTIIDAVGVFQAHVIDAATNVFKALGGVMDFISGVFTGNWKKAWQGVQDIFKGVFGALGDIAQTAIDVMVSLFKNIKWPKLKAPHIKVSYTTDDVGAKIGKFFGLPGKPNFSVNWLARGGIVNQPQLAMIGERGKEAVMPLENNTGWIRQLAQQVAAYIGTGGSLTEEALYRVGKRLIAELPKQAATIIVEMNRRVIAQEVIKELNRQNARYNSAPG